MKWEPLGSTPNYCSAVLSSHWTGRSKLLLGRASKPLENQVAFPYIPLIVTARACSAVTGRSKSLPGCTSKPLSARSRCSQASVYSTHLKTPHHRCSSADSARKHCAAVLGNHRALEIIARTSFFLFDSFRTKFFSRSLCFASCIASTCPLCDFTCTIRRHRRILAFINIL